MESKYYLGKVSNELISLIDNYEALNKLMLCLEVSGVFSEKLQSKVYLLSYRAQDLIIKQFRNEIENHEVEKLKRDLYEEFTNIFNSYCIFSDEFKVKCFGLFHTGLYYKLQS